MLVYELERITIELVSAIACFILAGLMTKISRMTRETRYLGLPLGFGTLGASYAFSAFSYSLIFDFPHWLLIQLFIRLYAFLFLVVTYYFSKSYKKTKIMWNTTLGMLIAISTIFILFTIVSPEISRSDYLQYYIFVRGFSFICLCYISIRTLKSHLIHKDLTPPVIPLAYFLLAIDQYSSIIWAVDASYFALFGGLGFRLASLAIFLFVSYSTFYHAEK
jgi:hypothetical protein